MTNIAEIINHQSSIAAVNLLYESRHTQRRRLGLSQVGHKCPRFLWYKHHRYDEVTPDGRTLRLFELGNILEDHLANDLRMCGFSITDQQKRVSFSYDDITLTGSIDGIISGLIESNKPHLWECKSMGSKGFAKLLKCGYEEYNPQYKGQIHSYMLGLKINRAFITVYNKDTSQLYQERIQLDKTYVIDMLQDVFNAISKTEPPGRACPRPDWFEAKWCPFYKECFNA